MYDFLSQPNKQRGIGHVLFAITKSCRISHSACRSLRLMAFQVKQKRGYTLFIHNILCRSAKEKQEIEFSVPETHRIIELYQDEDILLNQGSPDYFKAEKRNGASERMNEKLEEGFPDIAIFTVKHNWLQELLN